MANNILTGSYPTDLPQYPPYHNPQVYHLVKDESGESRSFLDRAFISFSYGGIDIEDFGLIATFEDNGKTGNAYANFEDLTSNYSVVDGQFYWGSHYTTDALNFTLATDGMTQKQLDAFKQHFRPGRSLPLILAEHPYRTTLARVSQTPTYTLVPFQEIEKYTILNIEKTVPVTVYRGTIQLSFVMDMPFWYGAISYFDTAVENLSEDELRGIVEDGIPVQGDIGSLGFEGAFIGNNKMLQSESVINLIDGSINPYNIDSLVEIEKQIYGSQAIIPTLNRDNLEEYFYGRKENGEVKLALRISIPSSTNFVEYEYYIKMKDGRTYYAQDIYDNSDPEQPDYSYPIATQLVKDEQNQYIWAIYKNGEEWVLNPQHYHGESIDNIQEIEIQFTLVENTSSFTLPIRGHISFNLNNSEAITTDLTQDETYSPEGFILFYAGTAPSKPIVKFTITPQFQEGGLPYIVAPINSFIAETNPYNVLNLTNTATGKVTQFKFSLPGFYQSYNQVIKLVSENWSLDWISLAELLRNSIKDYYIRAQAIKICEEEPGSIEDFCSTLKTNLTDSTATFLFNSATGEAIGKFEREQSGSAAQLDIEENVGDMVCGNYLVIEEQNHLINGQISSENCYQITTDYPGGLQNFVILYNNMYL